MINSLAFISVEQIIRKEENRGNPFFIMPNIQMLTIFLKKKKTHILKKVLVSLFKNTFFCQKRVQFCSCSDLLMEASS